MGDLYEIYRSDGWQIARERIGQDLRERYALSEQLPLRLLALVKGLDKRSEELALAASHVIRGRTILAGQEARIARLKALGCSTFNAEQSLKVFASTLAIFVNHERALRQAAYSTERTR
jgi:hypothetical protein